MNNFLEEIFDSVIDVSQVVDTEKGLLLYNSIYHHPLVNYGLQFSWIWRCFYGSYPTKFWINAYRTSNKQYGFMDIVSFIMKKTFIKYTGQFFHQAFKQWENDFDLYKSQLKSEQFCKHEISLKLQDRYCVSLNSECDNKSLYSIYQDILNLHVSHTIYESCLGACDLKNYFEQHKTIIKQYNLKQVNVITGYVLPIEIDESSLTLNIYECIRNVFLADHYFLRLMFLSRCVYVDKNVPEQEDMLILKTLLSLKDMHQPVVFTKSVLEKTCKLQFHVQSKMVFQNVPNFFYSYTEITNESLIYPHKFALTKYESVIYCPIESKIGNFNSTLKNDLRIVRTISNKRYTSLPNEFFLKISNESEIDKLVFEKIIMAHAKNNTNPSLLPSCNTLYMYDFVQRYIELFDINLPIKCNKYAPNCVVLVDNRANIMSVLSCKMTFQNLCSDKWALVVFTSKQNKEFYEMCLGDNVIVIVLDYFEHMGNFDIQDYNNILTDTTTWEHLKSYDKCLIIQDDGFIVRRGVEQFLEYDYVGAPWSEVEENKALIHRANPQMVGNGGISLRSIKMSIEICKEDKFFSKWLFFENLVPTPEDVFFANRIYLRKGFIPERKIANKFASEQVVDFECVGIHRIWSYNQNNIVREFFARVLKEKFIAP